MVSLKCISDSWNMIQRYNITGWEQVGYSAILIPESEYTRMYNEAKNKTYIRNLRK